MMSKGSHKLFFIFFSCVSLTTSMGCGAQRQTAAAAPEKVVTIVSPRLQEEILQFVNEYRLSNNLPALQHDNIIAAQAEIHSRNMASKKVAFSHDGFEERVQQINTTIGKSKASAENVAYGKISARQVVDFWLKSPGHRKNIEGNYSLTGIGTAEANDGTIFFTQIFLRK